MPRARLAENRIHARRRRDASIKESYEELNGWGEIKGYLQRAGLPAGMAVGDAPAEDPSRPMSIDEFALPTWPEGVRATKSGG